MYFFAISVGDGQLRLTQKAFFVKVPVKIWSTPRHDIVNDVEHSMLFRSASSDAIKLFMLSYSMSAELIYKPVWPTPGK
jgi:hypothetical protein